MPDVISLCFIGNRWTRPDEGHIPFQDIEKLGKLIQTRPAQKSADVCDPGIFSQLVDRLSGSAWQTLLRLSGDQGLNIILVHARVAVDIHGPEFQKHKRYAALSHPLLPIEYGTLRSQLYGDGNYQEQRGQNHDR